MIRKVKEVALLHFTIVSLALSATCPPPGRDTFLQLGLQATLARHWLGHLH